MLNYSALGQLQCFKLRCINLWIIFQPHQSPYFINNMHLNFWIMKYIKYIKFRNSLCHWNIIQNINSFLFQSWNCVSTKVKQEWRKYSSKFIQRHIRKQVWNMSLSKLLMSWCHFEKISNIKKCRTVAKKYLLKVIKFLYE